MSTGLILYLDFVVFLFGAVVGSFLNVCVHRMPRGESIVSPPSHCPHCNERIRWYDNIPLVSYVVLRGRCRHCGAPFTARYVLVELLTAVLFLAVWVKFGGWLAAIYWLLLAGLIASTFIDFEHFIIPNELTYGGIILGLLLSGTYPRLQLAASHAQGFVRSLLGMLAGGLTLWIVVDLGKLVFGRRKWRLQPGKPVVIHDGMIEFDVPPDKPLLYRLMIRLRWTVHRLLPPRGGLRQALRRRCRGLRPATEPGDAHVEMPLLDIFCREKDRIRFTASSLRVGEQQLENVVVVMSETTLELNGEPRELAQAGRIEARARQLVIPREAMGLGDVKFIAAIGAFLGWPAAFFTVFSSSLIGGVVGLLLLLFGRKDLHGRIPYGPYIALGAVIWIFCGRELVGWYLDWITGMRG